MAIPLMLRSLRFALPLLLAAALASAAPRRIPVILDTDIGDDIDDTWALVLALKSPELDLKLVVTDYGNTEQRAKLVARVLELAGRTDIPIGIGIKENDEPGPQAEWVSGFDLAKYRGPGPERRRTGPDRHRDGFEGADDARSRSVRRRTSQAGARARAAARRQAALRGNVRQHPPGLRRQAEARAGVERQGARAGGPRACSARPGAEAIVTPLDTCGVVQLSGERYARIRGVERPAAARARRGLRRLVPEPRLVREGPRVRRPEELDALRHRRGLPRAFERPRPDRDARRARQRRGPDGSGCGRAPDLAGRSSGRASTATRSG